MPPKENPLSAFEEEDLRLYFRVDSLGEDFVEGEPKKEGTQVVDVGNGAEAVKVAFCGQAGFLAAFL